MFKGLVLSAGIILAGIAPAAAAAPHQALRNIHVTAMASPAPVAGTAYVAFFAPGSATLSPLAQDIVDAAVQRAEQGRKVTLVVAEAAGLQPDASSAPVWRARIVAVRQAIAHAPAGQLSDQASLTRLAVR
ncbi:MAG: hypothetical protein KGJ75_03580 [Alphaproteobacteria bacterium]|nr:hypothetical protein [Alphaproteobacteria bacterium]MDE2074095.1 hypothetical protein [Alphaproteobacteria bacterium]MDE2350357.1 hypothetical protein [Alphaproteobacteria bacterium]